jgi:hypothetical protein
MLSDMVTDLWRWLRRGRMSVQRPVVAPELVLGGMAAAQLPAAVAAAVDKVPDAPMAEPASACGLRPTPFWTAAGVHGILSARRPCMWADVVNLEAATVMVPAAVEPRTEPTSELLLLEVARPVLVAPEAIDVRIPVLAQRLRQVREANRPLRHVPAVKRQARDVLSNSGHPAVAAKVKPVVLEPVLAEDWRAPTIRSRPTLVYAA